jgi:hypothetical protein
MKTFFAILTAALLSGCASGSAPFLTAHTNTTSLVVTNFQTIVQTVQQTNTVTLTNSVGQTNTVTVTNQVQQTNIVPMLQTQWTTNIVYTPAASVTNTIATIQAANTLTGPMDPFSGWITAALGLATAGLGWFAKVKTAESAKNASVANTVITAVEGLEPTVSAAVKAAVSAQAAHQGTSAIVYSAVQAATNPVANNASS